MGSPQRNPLRMAFASAHVTVKRLTDLCYRARRLLVVTNLRARAAWYRAPLECNVSRDVRFGRRVRFFVMAKTANRILVDEGCIFADDVRIKLGGGALSMGKKVDIRHACVLGIQGSLEMKGDNLVQHGTTIHCDDSIVIERWVGIGEYATVIDSSHSHDGPDEWFGHNLRCSPVLIEENAWIGANATIARGVVIGPRAVVSANSLVVKDVPGGWLASGVPAQLVRELGATKRGTDGGVREGRGLPLDPQRSAPHDGAHRDGARGRLGSSGQTRSRSS